MNEANLQELIKRYADSLERLNNREINEKFKWRAIGHFHRIWHSDLCERIGFAKMFAEARKQTSIMIDNSRKSPTGGIVKMAELEPRRVEELFRGVLLADDGGDIALRQRNVDAFVEGMEALRQQLFPKYWKYKQERSDALSYLSLIEPEQNYLYRYSVAESFSRYIEYGTEIGMGRYFRLELYYQMCDRIVEALRQHPDLIAAHDALLGEEDYRDKSLHIMAFDLMYCARTHDLYKGLVYQRKGGGKVRGQTVKASVRSQEGEKARLEKIAALQAEIDSLESELGQFAEVSVVGVEVYQRTYGQGRIIRQEMNKVWVQFGETEKQFTIHKSFIARPTFADDEEIVELFSEYGDKSKRLGELKRALNRLQA